MTSTKKRTAAVLTATILTATLTVPAMAIETPTIRVSSYKGNTLEVGERSGLIIGPSGADYTVISGDPDTVAVEQVLTFWVAVAKVEGSVKITVSNSAGECGSMTLTVSFADSASLEVPASGDSTSLIDNMEIRQEMTAKDEETDKIAGLTLGADDYVTKPFRTLELMARVKSQLRRYQKYNPARSDSGEAPPATPTDTIICGELTMNIKAHTCFLGEKLLTLTPTEFSILRILLENAGNVVSSEELFHKIWQDEYYSKSNNTITVHIRHLREKMGDSMDKPRFIKTIWGVGYKIES